MQVLINDSDVVAMVLEFLHSRQLYESAIAVERETGVLPAVDEAMPENLQYLRRLSLDGEWDNVLFYLEPFTELGEFNTNTLNYLVLRQKFIEILHGMSVNKTCSSKDKESLMKIIKEIQPYCSTEELQQMKALDKSYLQESGSLSASRFRCFKNIFDILEPIFDSYGPGAMGGEVGGDWIHHNPPSDCTRLESVMTDAMLFNECCRYCRDRALNTDSNRDDTGHPRSLTTRSLDRFDYDITSNAGLLFWIRSFQHDDIFRQRYEIEEVQMKREAIKKHKIAHTETAESPRKFSSFASPKKVQKLPDTELAGPSVARSMHLPPSSERNRPNPHHLAASGPPRHTYDHTTRNLSNNNNVENPEPQLVTHPEKIESPKQADFVEHNTPHVQDERLFQTENRKQENSPQPVVEIHDLKTIKIKQEPPWSQENEISQSLIAVPICETPLRDSSNLPITRAAQLHHIKVEDSYDQFMEEKRKQKDEHQQFLEQLEEKEKKNKEIRNLLLQQQADNSKNLHSSEDKPPAVKPNQAFQSSVERESTDILLHKDINENTKPPSKGVAYNYIPVNYTEDAQAVRVVEFHPSGQVYAVGSNSKTLRICIVPVHLISNYTASPKSQKELEEIKTRTPMPSPVLAKRTNFHRGSIYCAAWNDEGSLLATGSNDKLIKTLGFDILGKTLDETPQDLSFHRGIVREVTFLHESNNTLASAGADGNVFILDCNYKKQIHSLAGHTDNVLSLCSWDHGKLATASQDKTIRLWDVRTPSCVSIIGTSGQEPCFATSVCVDNSGRWLAMGLSNSKVGLYDRTAGKMALEYKCHSDEVRCVRFNPVLENQLLSSSYDGNVVLTDIAGLMTELDPASSHERHWSTVAQCKNKIIQCKWHPNGEAFATTSVDKTCKLWLGVNI